MHDEGGAQGRTLVVVRFVHQAAMKDEQVSTLHEHRYGTVHIVVDDLDIPEIRTRSRVWNMRVDVFMM